MTDYTSKTPDSAASNGLGLAGFIVSLVGLCSGGILAPIGLILSLIALKNEPKGFAIAGVVIGAVGSCGAILSFVLFGVWIVAALAAIGMAGSLFAILGPEIESTTEMAIISAAIEQYESRNQSLPQSIDDISDRIKGESLLVDHWGNPYVYELSEDGSTYLLYTMGPDGQPNTADDLIRQSSGDVQKRGAGGPGGTSPEPAEQSPEDVSDPMEEEGSQPA